MKPEMFLDDDSLTRIHERWLEPNENRKELDEFLEAEQEKKGILHAASLILSKLPGEDIRNSGDLNEAVTLIEKNLFQLIVLNDHLKRLEDILQDKGPLCSFN